MVPALSSCLTPFSDRPWPGSICQINPSLSKLFLVMAFIMTLEHTPTSSPSQTDIYLAQGCDTCVRPKVGPELAGLMETLAALHTDKVSLAGLCQRCPC